MRRPRRRRCRSANLDFYYGKFQALKDVNLDIAERARHGVHRPVGLRQVDAAAHAEPHVFAVSRAARHRRDPLQRRRTSSTPAPTSTCCAPRSAWCSRSRRRFRCRSTTTSRSACASTRTCRQRGDGRARRVGADQGGDVGRGEGQAEAERHGAVRRPAAAAVHRARGGGQARGAAARRADLGARPDLDRQDRGADLAS